MSETGRILIKYVEYLRKNGYDALENRNHFTEEKTIKINEIFISSSIGLLGFVSLGAFQNKDFSPYQLNLIYIFIFLSILSIIINFASRTFVAHMNESLFENRAKIAKELEDEIGKNIKELLKLNLEDFSKKLKNYKEREFSELNSLKKKYPIILFLILTYSSYIFFICEIISFTFLIIKLLPAT